MAPPLLVQLQRHRSMVLLELELEQVPVLRHSMVLQEPEQAYHSMVLQVLELA